MAGNPPAFVKRAAVLSDKPLMDKLSLFPYLLKRFGAYFGILLMVASCVYFFTQSTTKTDIESITLLGEIKHRIEAANKSGAFYLNGGKSKDLDDYNQEIVTLGKNLNELSQNLKGSPELQKKFLEIQKKSRNYFVGLNEKLEKKQNGRFQSDRQVAADDEISSVGISIDSMIQDLKENSSQSLKLLGVNQPLTFWGLLAGLLIATYSILRGNQLQNEAIEDQHKDVSEMKIQSILLDGILNSISEALLVIDEKGNFTRYNIAAQRIIGSKLRSISSESDAQAFGFFDANDMHQLSLMELPFARALRGEQVDDLEMFVRNETHPEGIYINISSRYLNDIDGSIRGALVVCRDISRRKATEQEWLRARESALETARKKSDFLAAMSHEIRTPMNGVMGMSTLLAETSLTEEQKDYVGTIRRSADALLRLINDILDHSKIEAGKIQMNLRPFDLRFVCEDIIELFYPAVREKNVGLELLFSGREEWNFVGDPERLRQVLVNLVGNAVKFTERGAVRVTVDCIKSAAGKSLLKFSVIDTGAGFNEEEAQFLFQKYFQTKSGMKYGGTGLGLSICHQLIDLMGGKIGLHSKPGVGSTFWFEVELPETTADQIPSQKESNFAPIFKGHILLAEDQLVNQRVAVTYLQKLGLTVDVANNGQIAVERVQKNTYDLIFMDCQMPVMTGYEATKKIREIQTAEKTPIVALTAEGTSGEKDFCFTAGMDDFLTKPLELEKLTAVLHRWLKNSPTVLDLQALEKLKTYVVNNKSLTEALIEDFAKSAPELETAMTESYKKQDLNGVQEAAHALKSTSATLGAKALAELCQTIEDIENLQDVKPLLDQVAGQLQKSLQELQKYATRAAA